MIIQKIIPPSITSNCYALFGILIKKYGKSKHQNRFQHPTEMALAYEYIIPNETRGPHIASRLSSKQCF